MPDPQLSSEHLRQDEAIRHVPKGWGAELWIHNDELYCGKILVLKGGKRCSLHYHKLKTESFYVQSGRLQLELTDVGATQQIPPLIRESFELGPGEAVLLRPYLVHRFTGLADETRIFEFSTQHFDEDSHRIVPGD